MKDCRMSPEACQESKQGKVLLYQGFCLFLMKKHFNISFRPKICYDKKELDAAAYKVIDTYNMIEDIKEDRAC